MNTQSNSVDRFIALVEQMRAAQREYFETKSNKAYREAMSLERLVDAWIVQRRDEDAKLAAWTGQRAS